MVVTTNHITIYSIASPYLKFDASNIDNRIFDENITHAYLSYWVKLGENFGRGDLILFKKDSKAIIKNDKAIMEYYFNIHDTVTQVPYSRLFIGSDLKLNVSRTFVDEDKVMIKFIDPISIYDKINAFIFGVTDQMYLSTYPTTTGSLKLFLIFVYNDWIRYYYSEYTQIHNFYSSEWPYKTEFH